MNSGGLIIVMVEGNLSSGNKASSNYNKNGT